jgi:cytosine deaminase
VSLGVQTEAVQRRVAEVVARAGISVVVLPQTNLYLQGRNHPVSTPRGLTAIGALRAAGVNVCAGADNVQDPFNLVGKGDPLETAALMVMAGHYLPVDAYEACSTSVRHALGAPPVHLRAGSPAELVAVRAGSVREAIAFQPADRITIHRGRVVAGA